MKNIRLKLLAIIVTLTSLFWACTDLDIEPSNILTDEQVFTSPAGINSMLQSLYMQLPIAQFQTHYNNIIGQWGHLNAGYPSIFFGEGQGLPLRSSSQEVVQLKGHYYSWWDYSAIRYCNIAIQQIKRNADIFQTNQATYNHWLGEVYFCRAYMYYAMVRSFGGIPIVKIPDTYLNYSDLKDLQIPRNTEKEVVDFIASDLDSAMLLMGTNELELGRANKFVAANLKARAMLFAASEAKYGTVQLNGLVGIPASEAKEYYKKAYSASQFVVAGGKYKLYRKYDDGSYMGKVKNYEQLFLDETSNTERMFVLPYDASINQQHCWDANQRPKGFSVNADPNGEISATMEWIELSDDVNGNPWKFNIGDPVNPIRYTNPADLFENVQPRVRATVLLPNVQWPASSNPKDIYEIRRGIYESYPNGKLYTSANWTDKYNGMTIQGSCGIGSPRVTGNGFIVWKYQQPNSSGAYWTSYTDWIEMRYGEVLLNKAEAAVNLVGETVDGKAITMNDALEPVNDIRSRAGTTALTTLNEERVIRERRIELAFENLTVWDVRRLRMLEQLVQNKTFSSLYPFYVADEKKYIFLRNERTELRYRTEPRDYYAPIPAASIDKNPKLLPNNPGY